MKIKKIFIFMFLILIMIFVVCDIHYHKTLAGIRVGKVQICTSEDVNKSQINAYMYDDNGDMYILYKNKWINATCENE
jgi:CMP-N-acetylneuraminic acid synthetase